MALSGFSNSNYITIESALVNAAPLTIAVWFRSTSSTTGQNPIVINGTTDANFIGLSVAGTVAGDPVIFYAKETTGSSISVNTTTGYAANTWQHACGVFGSATSRSVYINGGSKATSTTSVVPTSLSRINIGVYRTSTPLDAFTGSLAEVCLWNAALTDDEVASLAKGFTPDKIRPQSLVAYLPLIQNTQDIKGNAWTTVGSLTAADHPRIYS
jgi:hypothetical protein